MGRVLLRGGEGAGCGHFVVVVVVVVVVLNHTHFQEMIFRISSFRYN